MKLRLLWNKWYWRYRHNWGEWQTYHDNPQDGVDWEVSYCKRCNIMKAQPTIKYRKIHGLKENG